MYCILISIRRYVNISTQDSIGFVVIWWHGEEVANTENRIGAWDFGDFPDNWILFFLLTLQLICN